MEGLPDDFYEKYGTEWIHSERREWERICASSKVSYLLSIMGGLKPKSILDFGCGLGDALDMLARHYQTKVAIGIDIASTMIASAKLQYPRYSFIKGSIEKLDNIQVDLITFFDVLEHIEDIPSVLQAAKRSANWIAILIPLEKTRLISVLNMLVGLKDGKSRHYYSEGHLYEFNRSEVEQIIADANLRILAQKTYFSPQEIQFSTYMKRRIKAKTGPLARLKYYIYCTLGIFPYAVVRPIFQIGAGVNFIALCKC
jgi:SAM-dependent methyltransferase